jgi:ubiquitin carboxyl-terminal hydrolase 36/42
LKSEILTDTKYSSIIYEPFVALGLHCSSSLNKSLRQFIQYDKLDGDNKYYNPLIKLYENATKQFTIYRPPLVLIIHLKRYK